MFNCSVRSKLVDSVKGVSRMVAFDGREVECRGTSVLELEVAGMSVRVLAVVTDDLVEGD